MYDNIKQGILSQFYSTSSNSSSVSSRLEPLWPRQSPNICGIYWSHQVQLDVSVDVDVSVSVSVNASACNVGVQFGWYGEAILCFVFFQAFAYFEADNWERISKFHRLFRRAFSAFWRNDSCRNLNVLMLGW